MQQPKSSFSKILRRQWSTILLTGTPILLIFLMGYRMQTPQFEVFGTYRPKTHIQKNSGTLKPSRLKKVTSSLTPFRQPNNYLDYESKHIKNSKLLQTVILRLQLQNSDGRLVKPNSLRERIRLSSTPHNNAVRIALLTSDDHALTVRIIDGLMEEYVKRYGADTTSELANFSNKIQLHLQEAENLSDVTQRTLDRLRRESSNSSQLSPSDQPEKLSAAIESMRHITQKQLSTIDLNLAVLRHSVPLVSSTQNNLFQQVIQLSQTRKALLTELRIQLDQSPKLEDLPVLLRALEPQASALQRELVLAQAIYDDFQSNKHTLLTDGQIAHTSVQVLSSAQVSPREIRPFLLWFAGAGILSGLGVGIWAACIREAKDPPTQFLTKIYTKTQIPILGIIPHFSEQELSTQILARQETIQLQDFNKMMGGYHHTIQQLIKTGLTKHPKVIAFTSVESGEGKGLTIANLSYLMAEQGKKVLILDANLFQPCQPHYWRKNQTSGLCECVTGKILVDEAIQTIHPNLDILHAGSTQLSEDALLNSPGMSTLMQGLRSRYDHIFVDTPARSDSSHGYFLANSVDLTVLVLRSKQVDVNKIAHIREIVNRSERRPWGLIINDSRALLPESNISKIIKDSQIYAKNKQDQEESGELGDISTLSIINRANTPETREHDIYADLSVLERQRQENQYHALSHLSLEDLYQHVDRVWENWSHSVEFLLEQEEEILQQRLLVHRLQAQGKTSFSFTLNRTLQLKGEEEKLKVLADSYLGQIPTLIKIREELRLCLEILWSRTQPKSMSRIHC